MRIWHAVLILGLSLIGYAQSTDKPLPRRGALGVQLAPATADELKSAGIEKGIRVVAVIPGLTAAALKVEAGDIVTALNDEPVAATSDIQAVLRTLVEHDSVELTVFRGGKSVTLSGKLVARPKQKEDGFNVEYTQVTSLGKRIRVYITYPKGAGPFPTVFMLPGIGAFSMDGEYATIPYGKILEPLAKSSYVVVRMDKPGQGDSEGPAYVDLLFDEELDAYLQTLKLIKTKSYVDKNRIALFGHSMGGAFAPLVAMQEKVAAVASCATMAKSWIEYNLENNRRQMALGGAKGPDIDDAMRPMSAVLHYVYNDGLMLAQVIEKYPALKQAVLDFSPDQRTMSGVNIKFFQQLAKKNLPEAWSKVDAKVLSMGGEFDFIATGWDQSYIAEIVNSYRAGTAEYKLLKNSDHGFNTVTSFEDSIAKWGRPGNVHNTNVNDVLTEWLGRVLK